ncbi:YciI family protein [Gordonia sp. CPCC 205333]|uniref:YciI family protein n=1 Tax=Gordonia sp. CPCC 205333 TaxID=3140790 RepID=UPI003AF3E68F
MAVIAVEYTYPAEKLTVRDEHRPAHRAWLGGLLEAGSLILSGPYADGSGALFLVRADDENAAQALLADDPFQTAGAVSSVRAIEWTPVFGPVTP